MKKIIVVASVLLFLVSACGYRLSGSKADLPEGVKTIAVPPFENLTTEPDLGATLAEATQREILKRGLIKIAPVGKADAILKGKIEEIRLISQSYDQQGFTTAYRVRMEVSAQLTQGGRTIWSANKIIEEEEIAVGAEIRDDYVRRTRALAAVAEDVAEQIHIMLIEGW